MLPERVNFNLLVIVFLNWSFCIVFLALVLLNRRPESIDLTECVCFRQNIIMFPEWHKLNLIRVLRHLILGPGFGHGDIVPYLRHLFIFITVIRSGPS